ncbi:hypothetical protein VTH06DRAFT_4012 [Thermothelomyces fergusii]
MHTYSDEQLRQYLDHIGFRGDARQQSSADPLGCLTRLQHRHMARVPFESLSLHYSRHRLLCLDPEDLFRKIVDRGRGGYCMEVNTLFAAVLRTLGFTLFSAGGRVRGPNGYKGWDHMVNIVTIDGQRYLVDVGYGSNGPPHPIPLRHDHEFVGVAPARGRLQHRRLEEHADPAQRVWVFSTREDDSAAAVWREQYHFVETEFLPEDFEVMNLRTMTAPQSFFVQNVMCMWTLLGSAGPDGVQPPEGEAGGAGGDPEAAAAGPVGLLILHRDYVKRRVGAESRIIEQLESEEQRTAALEKYFGIVLSPEEKTAIRGLASELRPRAGHASGRWPFGASCVANDTSLKQDACVRGDRLGCIGQSSPVCDGKAVERGKSPCRARARFGGPFDGASIVPDLSQVTVNCGRDTL